MASEAGAGPSSDEIAVLPARRSRSARSEPGSVQSVDRALMLLDLLSRPSVQSGGGMSLTDLAADAQLNISTCHHLLATLMKWGYVAKVPGRRTYALGARVLRLGQAFMRQVDLPRRAQPLLERLGTDTGETVQLAVLQGDAVVTMAQREARQAVRVEAGPVGGVEPPHATAIAKAMLAWLPEDRLRRILAIGGMPQLTQHTLTDVDALTEELRHVRRNGFALEREEHQDGVIGLAAAVRDHTGAVIGALGVAAPQFRADDAHIAKMKASVMSAARELSAEFGAPAASHTTEDLPAAAERHDAEDKR